MNNTTLTLRPETIAVVKASIPALQTHGELLTKTFYRTMFERNPEVRNYFNRANQREGGKQPTALANSILAAAQHIENLPAILPAIQHIGHKHRSLHVTPELYPIVGENLLLALKEVFGDAADENFLQAWGEAYGVIANVFIEMEKGMNRDVVEHNGWEGYKQFVVTNKVEENERVTSFYLEPKDDTDLPVHQPGQYISVRFFVPKLGFMQPRQYSLSMEPNRTYYRISVKREQQGTISTFLHNDVHIGDVVEVAAPAGNFVLQTNEKPVVLLAGGIGVTPLMSMLLSLQKQTGTAVHLVQAVQNGAVHTFKYDVAEVVASHAHITNHVFYQFPREYDVKGIDFHEEGIVTREWMKEHLSLDATFYVCGPTPFMKHTHDSLVQLGVDSSRIRYEAFGPEVGLN